jgi:sec-independent protein translocase protein TatC
LQDKTFLEHLEDLRFVLLKSALAILVLSTVAFVFAPYLMKFIIWPFHAAVTRFDLGASDQALLRTLRPSGAFVVSMKMALGAGFTLALPLLLWFAGRFVFPGLTEVEKRYLLPALGAGTLLFLVGLSFCYFVILPTALGFFWRYGQKMGIANEWTVEYYVSLVVQMLLAFGVVFELPIVLLFMAKVGIVGHQGLRKARKYVIVGIFILAAAITPTPDMISQIMLAVPMVILYEFCVWMSRWMVKE